jgi:tRNA threonylcarbamoyladenosine biosynthesis protein TsaB
MKILGLSTATKTLTIGLIDDDRVLCEHSVSGEQTQAENLVPYLKALLDENGFKIEEAEAISVTTGPGSYSGLRGGLAAAKSLAQVLDCKLIGVSTLEAIAYNMSEIEGTIMVIIDAIKNELNIALFGAHQGKITRLIEDSVVTEDGITAVLKQVKGELYVVSNVEINRPRIYSGCSKLIKSAAEIRGVKVARLGLKILKEGKSDDFLSLSPQYSHQPNIKVF